jgi:hypothetical protein
MTLRRVARPRLLVSHCLLENSRGCFREIALFPILLFFRFALRFGHVESCHRSTLREILKFRSPSPRLPESYFTNRLARERVFKPRGFSFLSDRTAKETLG